MISRFLVASVIFMVAAWSSNAYAQLTGCETMSFSLTSLGPCHYRLNVLNSSQDCYSQATVLLQSGAFTSWSTDAGNGWIGNQTSDTEIVLTHTNGLFPADTSWVIEFTFYDAGAVETPLAVLYDNACILEGCVTDLVLEACDGGCVAGTIYHECEELPYQDQPVLEEWEIEILDSEGSILGSTISDVNGFYEFCDLEPGPYTLRAKGTPGWTPKVPASGMYSINVVPEFSLIRDFGNCPSCSCDSVFTGLQLQPLSPDPCTFSFTLVNNTESCYNSILIQLHGSNQFEDWNIEMAEWDVVLNDEQQIEIFTFEDFIPIGFFVPVSFSVTGADVQDYTITLVSNDGPPGSNCERAVVADCEPMSQSCCPSGSVLGPQLIVNGDFELGNTGFTSDHGYIPTGLVSWGNYSIRDFNTLPGAKAGNIWSCLDHTTGTIPGKFMVCNHGGIHGDAVWRTTVQVEAGKEYVFCTYLNNLMKPGFNSGGCNDPQMELWVDVTMVASMSINELPDAWVALSGVWTASATGTVTLQILDSNGTLGCNDIALDDISFRTCGPVPCTASFNVVPVDGCGHVQVINTSTGVQPLTYQWCTGETSQDLDVIQPCGPYNFCLTVTCGDGNTSEFSQVVDFSDQIAPTLQCPQNVTLSAFQPTCSRPVTNIQPLVLNDNCGIPSLSWILSGATTGSGIGDASGQVFNQGITTLIYTAQDACGNTTTCSMVVTIECAEMEICCLEWAGKIGSSNGGDAEVMTLDPTGNLLVAGAYAGTFDFDPGPGVFNLSSVTSTASDIYVTKWDAAGNFILASGMGGPGLDYVSDVATDGAGNIYLSGFFEMTADFDPGPNTVNLTSNGTNDGFLLKLSSTGQFLWVIQLGSPSFDWAVSVHVDGVNDVYCSGYFRNTVDFDPGPAVHLLTSAGGSDVFLAKYTSGGSLIRAQSMGSSGHDYTSNMTIDGSNSVYVGGTFTGTVDFDPGPGVQNLTGGPVFIFKQDPAGNLIWASAIGGYYNVEKIGLAIDIAGNVLSTGILVGTQDFDPGAGVFNLTSAGVGDIFVCKLNSTGGLVWAHQYGDAYNNAGTAIATDQQGNVLATGWTNGVVDFDPGPGQALVTAQGNYVGEKAYILKLDPSGNFMWVKSNEGLGRAGALDIIAAGNGTMYWSGGFVSTVDFRPGSGTYFLSSSSGRSSGFVAKYSPCPLPEICYCGTYTDLYIRDSSGRLRGAPACGQTINVGCPPPGAGFILTGNFQCAGTSCPPLAPIDWALQAPNGTNLGVGTLQANYWFSLPLSSTNFLQSGIYTLTLTGLCGAETCSCTIFIEVDPGCPDPCPCDSTEFKQNVDQGFATVHSGSSCNVCFAPIALDDCDRVEWFVNSTLIPSVGTSTGNQTFCYALLGTGVYTIYMVVSRYRADGIFCAINTKSQRITISCHSLRNCEDSVFENPGFSEDAIAGGIDTTGNSKGWIVLSDHPTMVEGHSGSQDGWTMQLTGKIDSMDILGYGEAVCLARDTGTISVRLRSAHWGDPHEILNGKHDKKWGFQLYRGNQYDGISCQTGECLKIASIDLADVDTGWLEIRIPYDLREWGSEDTCGGVLVRPAIFVESVFGLEQGGDEVRSRIQMDDICFGGQLLAVHEQEQQTGIKFYPNPAREILTIVFDNLARSRCVVEVTDLWGRMLKSETVNPDNRQHPMEVSLLPPGLYMLTVKEEGMVVWTDKFVRVGN